MKGVTQLKAARIDPPGVQFDHQGIAAGQGRQEVGLAMDDRQGDGRGMARAWEHLRRRNAEALQALLVGLMAPAQQLVEVHHAGGVGVTEAHAAAEQQPAAGVNSLWCGAIRLCAKGPSSHELA